MKEIFQVHETFDFKHRTSYNIYFILDLYCLNGEQHHPLDESISIQWIALFDFTR